MQIAKHVYINVIFLPYLEVDSSEALCLRSPYVMGKQTINVRSIAKYALPKRSISSKKYLDEREASQRH